MLLLNRFNWLVAVALSVHMGLVDRGLRPRAGTLPASARGIPWRMLIVEVRYAVAAVPTRQCPCRRADAVSNSLRLSLLLDLGCAMTRFSRAFVGSLFAGGFCLVAGSSSRVVRGSPRIFRSVFGGVTGVLHVLLGAVLRNAGGTDICQGHCQS